MSNWKYLWNNSWAKSVYKFINILTHWHFILFLQKLTFNAIYMQIQIICYCLCQIQHNLTLVPCVHTKPMYSFGKWWKLEMSPMGFVCRVLWVLKDLWIFLSETINFLRKLHKTNISGCPRKFYHRVAIFHWTLTCILNCF